MAEILDYVRQCDHLTCWKLVATIEGRKSTNTCPVSKREQRMHYVKVDENNGGDAGYDWARAREADQLMRDFLAEPNRAH